MTWVSMDRRHCLTWGSEKCPWKHLFAFCQELPRLSPLLATHTDFHNRSDNEPLWKYSKGSATEPHRGRGPFVEKAMLRNKFSEPSTPRALQLALYGLYTYMAICSVRLCMLCPPPTASSGEIKHKAGAARRWLFSPDCNTFIYPELGPLAMSLKATSPCSRISPSCASRRSTNPLI